VPDSLLLTGLVVYFLAGSVKGTLGIGLPTTAVSLMAQVSDARTAIAIVIIPMAITNAWQVYRSTDVVLVWRRYWPLAVCMMVFIAIFSQVAVAIPARTLTFFLGVIVTLFAAVNLWRQPPLLARRYDLPAQVITGSIAGIMGGITGVWAPPVIAYLSASRLDKEQFVSTIGLLLLLGSLVLCVGYWRVGIIQAEIAHLSIIMLVPAMLGFAFGEQLRQRLSGDRFRIFVLLFFLVMGLNLMRRAYGM
jgi:uncharacterized membrane protein YfcA